MRVFLGALEHGAQKDAFNNKVLTSEDIYQFYRSGRTERRISEIINWGGVRR